MPPKRKIAFSGIVRAVAPGDLLQCVCGNQLTVSSFINHIKNCTLWKDRVNGSEIIKRSSDEINIAEDNANEKEGVPVIESLDLVKQKEQAILQAKEAKVVAYEAKKEADDYKIKLESTLKQCEDYMKVAADANNALEDAKLVIVAKTKEVEDAKLVAEEFAKQAQVAMLEAAELTKVSLESNHVEEVVTMEAEYLLRQMKNFLKREYEEIEDRPTMRSEKTWPVSINLCNVQIMNYRGLTFFLIGCRRRMSGLILVGMVQLIIHCL